MLHTFIFIVGIAALLLFAKTLTRLAGIDKHLDGLIDKSVSLTLELRQLHSDLNRNSAQTIASMSTATITMENAKDLLEECKQAVVPLMETQSQALDDIRNRFTEYEAIVKAAADGGQGTLLVEDPATPQAETEDNDQAETEVKGSDEESPSPVERGQAVAETLEQ